MFSRELLQAISDWQQGGSPAEKATRGQALAQLAAGLPRRYREVAGPCYRKVALTDKHAFELGVVYKLPETVSGWTLDIEIAKQFKKGVPPAGWRGVIFDFRPTPEQVVINLDAVYQDPAFCDSCAREKSHLTGYALGIGKYKNSQREVVLRLHEVEISNIFAIGGFIADESIDSLVQECLGRSFEEAEAREFESATARSRGLSNQWWLQGPSKDRIIQFWTQNAQRLNAERARKRDD